MRIALIAISDTVHTSMHRRTFLAKSAAVSFLPVSTYCASTRTAEEAVSIAHEEIWSRFIDDYGIMLDFADYDGSVELPTPEECRLGKPNALGWWTPIENGGFFNGLYLEAMLQRWKLTGEESVAAKARRLVDGLLLLNSISEVEGFVGRGVCTDGVSHYAMGSNDQTFPWIYGLWRFLESGMATEEEATKVKKRIIDLVETIAAIDWMMPAEEPFGVRGGFLKNTFESAPRLLFTLRIMNQLTGDPKWLKKYQEALGEGEGKTRADFCEEGMKFEKHRHSWTAGNSVAALRALWELEDDTTLKERFKKGIQSSVDVAMESFPLADKYPNNRDAAFNFDWKMMNAMWKPHSTEKEAVQLAMLQLREFRKTSPKRGLETTFVREPVFAAWIATLEPDRDRLQTRKKEISELLAKYDPSTMIFSQFFPMEIAWWRMKSELS
ncbi:MAG: hypothetical protein CMO55_27855 [Verrucomicrobiales bacterium]|nr:hypothetical protein [Verrucomicrobiales bacterium]